MISHETTAQEDFHHSINPEETVLAEIPDSIILETSVLEEVNDSIAQETTVSEEAQGDWNLRVELLHRLTLMGLPSNFVKSPNLELEL